MSDSLLPYYESELRFIRELAQEFAGHYPTRAGRLGLDRPQAIDPHVERLIEAFALLTGRIQPPSPRWASSAWRPTRWPTWPAGTASSAAAPWSPTRSSTRT